LKPAELAEIAPRGLPAYMGIGGGVVTGYGIAAALSGVTQEPGELGTQTKQIAQMLQRRVGKPGAFWSRLGFNRPGERPVEQIQAMYDAGVRTMGDLEAAGFSQEQSLGMQIMLGTWEQNKATIANTRALYQQPGIISAERMRMEAEAPMIETERRIREVEAMRAGLRTAGKPGELAMQRDLAFGMAGTLMEGRGFGRWAEAGQTPNLAMAATTGKGLTERELKAIVPFLTWWEAAKMGPAAGAGYTYSKEDPTTREEGLKVLQESMDALRRSLDENTAGRNVSGGTLSAAE